MEDLKSMKALEHNLGCFGVWAWREKMLLTLKYEIEKEGKEWE